MRVATCRCLWYACDESAPLRRGYLGPKLGSGLFLSGIAGPAPKPAHAGDLLPVDARYEPFTLTRWRCLQEHRVGDCELVEEFVREILPRLSARVAFKQDITWCITLPGHGQPIFCPRGDLARCQESLSCQQSLSC